MSIISPAVPYIAPENAQGCPAISHALRYEFGDAGVTVPTAYATLYTYSGSGKFFGVVLDFNNINIRVKLTVDTVVIFELELSDINDVQIPGVAGQQKGIYGMVYESTGNRLRVEPAWPIAYEESIKFEAQRTSVPDKSLDRHLIALTKET